MTILAAKDNIALREPLSFILNNYGYNVIEAVNEEDEVVKYNEKTESVRLPFLDAVMPKKMEKRSIRRSVP